MSSRFTAVALTVGGVAVLGVPLVYRLSRLEGLTAWVVGGGAIALYVAWQAAESRISAGELAREEAQEDRGTMPLAAAASYGLLLAALLGGGEQRWDLGAGALIALALGVGLRTRAISRLGAAYSHRIRPVEALVSDGVYGTVRHPAYAGTLLAHAAVPLAFPNPYALAAYLLLWTPAVLIRTAVEDRVLKREASYAECAARTWRLIPGLW